MKIILIPLLILATLTLGCKRRPLVEDVGSIAMIPIHIDWSKSSLSLSDIHSVTVRVFPHDGSRAYNFTMEANKTDDVIPLSIGKYSFVIFNETLNKDDWESLVFEGVDDYNSFVVTTSKDEFKGLYAKSDPSPTNKNPDNIAVFSIDEFEVTQDMVTYTNTASKGDLNQPTLSNKAVSTVSKSIDKMSNITPTPITRKVNILARVENLGSAKRSSGALVGLAGAISMSTGKPTALRIKHIFIMNGRVYDDPATEKNGTIGASFYIFDQSNTENLMADFQLDFLLHNNTNAPSYIFDITNDLKSQNLTYNLKFGFLDGGRKNDHRIVLPQLPGGVGVDDWSDEIVPVL